MKKKYIVPEVLVVEVSIKKNFMLTASSESGTIISYDGEGDGTDIGAKEITNSSLWDEEW